MVSQMLPFQLTLLLHVEFCNAEHFRTFRKTKSKPIKKQITMTLW